MTISRIKIKNIAAFLAAALSLSSMLPALSSCGTPTSGDKPDVTGEGNHGVTTGAGENPIAAVTTTYRIAIPNLLDDNYKASGDPDYTPIIAEIPITGKNQATAFHNSHRLLTVDTTSVKATNFTEWHDKRTVLSLFDGDDNYFSGEGNKMGGGVSNGELIVEFSLVGSAIASAYAFVTGNDSGQYAERTPGAWTLYGSADGKNWKALDEVKDSGMVAKDAEYFGYEIDEEARFRCRYYRIVFTEDLNGFVISSFQLNQMYLYSD